MGRWAGGQPRETFEHFSVPVFLQEIQGHNLVVLVATKLNIFQLRLPEQLLSKRPLFKMVLQHLEA